MNAVKTLRVDSYTSVWTDLEEMYKTFCKEVERYDECKVVDREIEYNPTRQQWVLAVFYTGPIHRIEELEKWHMIPKTPEILS